MFELMIKTHFDASHTLPFHEGKCRRPHGHTYHIEISFASETLDSNGMGVDFYILKKAMKRVEDLLDHRDLNIIFDVFELTTTAENICLFIYASLSLIADENMEYIYRIKNITIWETPSGGCKYTYDENDLDAILMVKAVLNFIEFDRFEQDINAIYDLLINLDVSDRNVLVKELKTHVSAEFMEY